MLKVAVANIDRTVPVDAYAFEIAHHVRSKVLSINTEGPENLMLLVPRGVAELQVEAKDTEASSRSSRSDFLLSRQDKHRSCGKGGVIGKIVLVPNGSASGPKRKLLI